MNGPISYVLLLIILVVCLLLYYVGNFAIVMVFKNGKKIWEVIKTFWAIILALAGILVTGFDIGSF